MHCPGIAPKTPRSCTLNANKVADTLDKPNRAMLANQTACNEAFAAKAIKDFKTAISKTMESELTK
eukprot:11193962-Lingulodinium_polyedra.AAC.1